MSSLNRINFHLLHPDAVKPTKAHPDDAGWDLTAIHMLKDRGDGTKPDFMLETGIAVVPPIGTFTMVVPRSSFSKSGFSLANSVGVIDPSYRGTIKVAVNVCDYSHIPEFPSFPWKCMQLLVLPLLLPPANYLTTKPDETDRGEGGFGSSDK